MIASVAPTRPSVDEILIGTCAFGQRKDEQLRVELEDVARHLLAIGTTGSGKTVVLKAVVESLLVRRIPAVLIDVMGDLTGMAIPAAGPEAYANLGLPTPVRLQAEDWAMGAVVAKRLERVVHARYLTPCSDVGERLAISPLPKGHKKFDELLARDRDDVELQASAAAYSLMGRVGLKQPKDGVGGEAELVRGLLTEAILSAWALDIDLDGITGISAFTELVERVFGQSMPGSSLDRFKSGMKSLTVGQAARWLEGNQLDWDELLRAPEGKTSLVIIAIDHLPREHHPWIVSQVINSASSWCASQPPAPGRPRLAIMVDELASEGGRLSLLPPLTYSSTSGQAIRRVLRQGRHWGMCMLAGTQSPRDVDSKNFSQFNNRFIGKLLTNYDVRAALAGTTMSEERARKMADMVKSTSAPRMFYIQPNGSYEGVRVRWLGSLHSKVPKDQIAGLYERGLFKGRPGSSRRSGSRWSLTEAGLFDAQGHLVVLACSDTRASVRLTTLAAATPSLTCRLDDAEGMRAAAVWLGIRAARSGLRLCAPGAADLQREARLAAELCGVPLLGIDEPWYCLEETLRAFPEYLDASVISAGPFTLDHFETAVRRVVESDVGCLMGATAGVPAWDHTKDPGVSSTTRG